MHESILFGVVVGPTTDVRIAGNCIKSIYTAETVLSDTHYKKMRAPGLDVVVCGSTKINYDLEIYLNSEGIGGYADYINFDESEKPGWITRKKNLIVGQMGYAYDLNCFVHDYYKFDQNFLLEFYRWRKNPINKKYQLIQPAITTKEGTRHSDWLVSQRYIVAVLQRHPELQELHKKKVDPGEQIQYVCGLPYDEDALTHIQYISGGFIFGETTVFQAMPFDENRCWGQEEDIEWSMRVANARIKLGYMPYEYKPLVTLQKPNKWHLKQMPDETLAKLKEYFKELPVQDRNYY